MSFAAQDYGGKAVLYSGICVPGFVCGRVSRCPQGLPAGGKAGMVSGTGATIFSEVQSSRIACGGFPAPRPRRLLKKAGENFQIVKVLSDFHGVFLE